MNSLIVTEIIARSIENGCKEMVRKSVMMCSEKYGFDGVEAIEYLNLSGMKLERKVMRRSKGKKEKSRKVPMPFSREMVLESGCQGIRYNGGLYSQCLLDCLGKEYCNTCKKECEMNGTDKPDNGSISDRMKVGIMEYKDVKGRSPKEYLKVLKKLNIREEEAREEASKNNYIIDEIHFERKERKEKEVKGDKGRPKKEKKEVEAQVVKEVVKEEKKVKKVKKEKEEKVDLFAELASESSVEVEEKVDVDVVVDVVEKKKNTKKSKKVEFVEDAEAVDKKDAEEDKEEEAKKAADKKDAEEKAKKEAKEKAKKEAKEKAKKDAEEKAKKEADKKEAEEKAKKEAEEQAKKDAEEQAKKDAEKKKVSVTRFEFEGKKYLKSSENILYDADTKEEMGIWCEETKSIKELPDDDDEEEEEEYDE